MWFICPSSLSAAEPARQVRWQCFTSFGLDSVDPNSILRGSSDPHLGLDLAIQAAQNWIYWDYQIQPKLAIQLLIVG